VPYGRAVLGTGEMIPAARTQRLGAPSGIDQKDSAAGNDFTDTGNGDSAKVAGDPRCEATRHSEKEFVIFTAMKRASE